MSFLVDLESTFDGMEIEKKIDTKSLTLQDLKHIDKNLTIQTACFPSIIESREEPNETWCVRHILVSLFTMRLYHFQALLNYVAATKLNVLINPLNPLIFQPINYITAFSGSNPYRKEMLMNYTCKIAAAVNKKEFGTSDYDKVLICSYRYIQKLMRKVLRNYIDPHIDPDRLKILSCVGEFTFKYPTNRRLGNVELHLEDYSYNFIYRNGSILPDVTHLSVDLYPRYWDPDDPNYDPNHFFSSLFQSF